MRAFVRSLIGLSVNLFVPVNVEEPFDIRVTIVVRKRDAVPALPRNNGLDGTTNFPVLKIS